MTTPAKVPHKERMLRAGIRLLYDRGYNGTSVDAVLTEAEAPKGSFYHHFGSKERFGQVVLGRYDDIQAARLRSWAEQENLSVPERLAGYHRASVDALVDSNWRWACLAGKLSNELAASSDTYRGELARGFVAWSDALAEMLLEGQQRGEVRTDRTAKELADASLALVQGAFVAALALRGRGYLDAVTTSLVDLISPRPNQ
ncbi:TetR/AcrR family transcriptional regulator [Aeromicrobium sp. HA]|uniref:TetR/AcrR family transcriptional regulator n=1 Tax=Aeromicrobium sp. HA TaxID=3009077 RepID=UPI0022AF9387|nr:TetR/AcrR family transcriptional regulator [Aeromicrobium sp. HA]